MEITLQHPIIAKDTDSESCARVWVKHLSLWLLVLKPCMNLSTFMDSFFCFTIISRGPLPFPYPTETSPQVGF
jgi:hypothetical protein